MTKHNTLVAAWLSLALAGCGGGGSNSSTPVASAPSPAPGPSPAPAPFAVVSTTPAEGATGVARSSVVSFTTNQAIDYKTITGSPPDDVQLLTPEGVDVVADTLLDVNTLTIVNSSLALAGNTTYTAKLPALIGNSAGATLGAPYTWSFRTASASWATSGTNISSDGNFAAQLTVPGLATDQEGNVFASWIDTGTSGDFIAVQMFNAASKTWNASATTVFTSVSGNLGTINLTNNPAGMSGGEPILTWVGYQANNNLAVYLSTFRLTAPGTGTWSTPVITPIEPPGNSQGFLAIPVDISQVSDGHILTLAARIENSGGTVTPGIYISQYDEVAQTWSTSQIFNATALQLPYGRSVATAVDANGNATVAWIDGLHLYATTKSPSGTTWRAATQIDTLASGSINSLALGAGVAGTTLSWAQTSGANQPTIEVSRLSTDLVTWSAPLQLDDGSSPTGAMNPSIAVDNAGYADISYTQTNTSNTVAATNGVFLARYDPFASTWGRPLRMSTLGSGVSSSAVATAVDIAGNVQLFYQVGNAVAAASFYVSSATAVDEGLIDSPNGTPSGVAYTPSVIFGPDNVATAAWVNFEISSPFIRADRKQ